MSLMLEVDKDLSLCIMCQSTRRTHLRTVHYTYLWHWFCWQTA